MVGLRAIQEILKSLPWVYRIKGEVTHIEAYLVIEQNHKFDHSETKTEKIWDGGGVIRRDTFDDQDMNGRKQLLIVE